MKIATLIGATIFFVALPVRAQTPPQSGSPNTSAPVQPGIVGHPGRWLTNDDYPLRAVNERREGNTRFKLTIDPAGRISHCEIISSSGHADLDAQTCRVLHRRARFVKAPELAGPRYFESRFSWNLQR